LDAFRARDRDKADEATTTLRSAAILMAKANLLASSVCRGNLHSLLVNASVCGWVACSTRDPASGEKELAREAVNVTIPHFATTLMTKALDVVYQE
jgi:hypothetical protein